MPRDIPENLAADLGAVEAQPVNLLEILFPTGTAYLSDRDLTVGARRYRGLVCD